MCNPNCLKFWTRNGTGLDGQNHWISKKLKSFDLVFQHFRNILIFNKNFVFQGKNKEACKLLSFLDALIFVKYLCIF